MPAMKPGDYTGYSPDTTDDGAMAAFLVKHPEEIGAALETIRTGGCVLIQRRRDGQAHGANHNGDVLADGSRGGADVADAARGEVNDGDE